MEWRPDDGIRSVREAILHVAERIMESVPVFWARSCQKASIRGNQEYQEQGRSHRGAQELGQFVKEAIGSMDDAALAEPIKLFGQDSNHMGAAICWRTRYEHLGQLIAYARSSGVVPPWSQ